MADSILRLKVDSQEYDNKLKRAAQGLQQYADGCRKAGGTLERLDDGVLEFTKALGQMETVSKSAKGSIGEMTKAFTDMSVQYNKLTDAEKASPFGQALKGSLDELKGRIQAGNTEIKNINDSLNGGGGLGDALNSIASKFGLNIDKLTKFGSVLGAASAALKVAKDAFFASETNLDDWGSTVAAAEGVYDSFLQSINNSDFSGFLQRIGEVITKAKEAYNALDELGTRMTIINPERTKLQARATELKAIIRREGANSEKGQAAQAELRQLEVALSKSFKTESQLNYNAFKALVDAKLQQAGIKLSKKDYDFLMRTFSSDASYTAMRRGAKGSIQTGYEAGGSYDEGSVYRQDTRNINQKLLDLFTDEWRHENSQLLNAAFSARGGAASVMLSDARYLKNSSGGGGGSTGPTYAADSVAAQQALVRDLQKQWSEAGAEVRNSYIQPLVEAENKLKQMQNEQTLLKEQANGRLLEDKAIQVPMTADVTGLIPTIDELREYLKQNPIIVPINTTGTNDSKNDAQEMQKGWQNAASAISSVGSAMASIEDPAAKVMGIVAQAIATVALAYAKALETDWSSKSSIWSFIAAAAAGTASMITTIASIHSATGYAQGGMIKGNSYSGDNMMAMGPNGLVGLNAGEIVLNQAQARNVAAGLQNNGMSGMRLQTKVRGTELLVWLDNSLAQSGRGELVTWGT